MEDGGTGYRRFLPFPELMSPELRALLPVPAGTLSTHAQPSASIGLCEIAPHNALPSIHCVTRSLL